MFEINGIDWNILFVHPQSDYLERSDGSRTVGMTYSKTYTVYLSDMLQGEFLRKVLCHELCHCFCMSYNVYMPIDQEEYLADWVSTYGAELIYLLDDLMSDMLRRAA